MHLSRFAPVAMAAALLALPAAALAAPDQNTNNNNQCTQWNNNGQCVQWNNNGNNNNNGRWNNTNNGRDQRDRDDRNGNNRGYGNGNYGRSGQLDAVVSSFSPYNLYLANGTHVELHNGTVINPTGFNLRGGEHVRVSGTWNGDGTFSANQIDVIGRGGNWR